jgi:hypothetical protein
MTARESAEAGKVVVDRVAAPDGKNSDTRVRVGYPVENAVVALSDAEDALGSAYPPRTARARILRESFNAGGQARLHLAR